MSYQQEWPGTLLDPTLFKEPFLGHRHELADAARHGNWEEVFRLLDAKSVNSWRPGGPSWFTPLHQAARLGAPTEVAQRLITQGAWRTMQNKAGETPGEVARVYSHDHLEQPLTPDSRVIANPDLWPKLDRWLAALIESRIRPQLTIRLRHPQSSVLAEMPEGATLWMPVPGMYGGFSIQLLRSYLFVQSSIRIVEGSGQAHVVTTEGYTMVEEGFA